MNERIKYQRPGVDSGNLLTEKGYQRPDTPSVPDVLETTAEDTKERPESVVPDVLAPTHHVGLGEAVPVRVINFARELDRVTQVTAYQRTIAAGQTTVIAGRRNRTRMVVANTTDGATVYLGHEDIRSAGVGFPIVGGKELTQHHSSTVYVHNPHATDDAVIGVMEEYTTELR